MGTVKCINIWWDTMSELHTEEVLLCTICVMLVKTIAKNDSNLEIC